jgi:hypothetical protein
MLSALLIFLSTQQHTFANFMVNSGYNMAFLLVQFLLLAVYFSVRAGTIVNITSGYLGWGDILFLLCIAFYLSPINYFVFYILSLLLVLMLVLISTSLSKRSKTIPLAGLQAFLFALVFIADWYIDVFNITNDYWLLTYLRL